MKVIDLNKKNNLKFPKIWNLKNLIEKIYTNIRENKTTLHVKVG